MLALALMLAAAASAPQDAAVVVGISRYYALPAIPGAADNASDWFRWLTTSRGLSADRVHLLRDDNATREEIEAATRAAATTVGPRGTLWFVFVGHGAPDLETGDGLLLGVDTQPKEISVRARGLARNDVITLLARGRQAHTLMVLDACFSGSTPDGKAELVPAMMATVPVRPARPSRDITVLASSATAAGPLPGRARPAFSAILLGALRGWADTNRDSKVDVDEAFAFTDKTLTTLVRDRDQRPSRIGPSFVASTHATEQAPDFAAVAAARDIARAPATTPMKPVAPAEHVLLTFTGLTPMPESAPVSAVVIGSVLRIGVSGQAPREIPLAAVAEARPAGFIPLLTPPLQIILRDGSGIFINVDVGQRDRIVQDLNALAIRARTPAY